MSSPLAQKAKKKILTRKAVRAEKRYQLMNNQGRGVEEFDIRSMTAR